MGIEAVGDRILTGNLFACFGFRPGGFLGVYPVGRQFFLLMDIYLPCHNFPLIGRESEKPLTL